MVISISKQTLVYVISTEKIYRKKKYSCLLEGGNKLNQHVGVAVCGNVIQLVQSKV